MADCPNCKKPLELRGVSGRHQCPNCGATLSINRKPAAKRSAPTTPPTPPPIKPPPITQVTQPTIDRRAAGNFAANATTTISWLSRKRLIVLGSIWALWLIYVAYMAWTYYGISNFDDEYYYRREHISLPTAIIRTCLGSGLCLGTPAAILSVAIVLWPNSPRERHVV